MAFLSTEDRFGPVLNSIASIEPHPCSYDPRAGPRSPQSNRRGTFGAHHDQDVHSSEMSKRLQHQVDKERQASQLQESWRLKQEHPGPTRYSPVVKGQFPPAYTTHEIAEAAAQSQRCQPATSEPSANATSVETLGLALGPGSYDVGRDYNQERIATPFTFGRAKRAGILELVRAQSGNLSRLGPGSYYKQQQRLEPDATKSSPASEGCVCPPRCVDTRGGGVALAQSAFRSHSVDTFLARVRSDSALGTVSGSEELTTSYKQLQSSLQTLNKRLVRGKARTQAAERTGHSLRTTDASRRGPGSYERQTASTASPPASPSRRNEGDEALDAELCSSMASAGFTDAEVLGRAALQAVKTGRKSPTNNQELRPAGSEPATHMLPPKSSFGRVQSRNLLVSMAAAGHLNPETLGPGVYETVIDWGSHSPSHNINYTSEFLKKQRRQYPRRARQQQHGGEELGSKESEARTSSSDDSNKGQTTSELWRAMRTGPSLPTSATRR